MTEYSSDTYVWLEPSEKIDRLLHAVGERSVFLKCPSGKRFIFQRLEDVAPPPDQPGIAIRLSHSHNEGGEWSGDFGRPPAPGKTVSQTIYLKQAGVDHLLNGERVSTQAYNVPWPFEEV